MRSNRIADRIAADAVADLTAHRTARGVWDVAERLNLAPVWDGQRWTFDQSNPNRTDAVQTALFGTELTADGLF